MLDWKSDADMNAAGWIELVHKSGIVPAEALLPWSEGCSESVDVHSIAAMMVEAQLLTAWQADLLLRGKWKGFLVDHYCLLNQLERDDSRGTRTFSAVDKDTGSHVILEIVHPSRARAKDGRLFYVVRDGR